MAEGEKIAGAASLNGRVALVTGGGTGIGAAITMLLAERGASVVICQPDQNSAEKLAAAIRSPQRDVIGIGADVGDASACSRLIDACVSRRGRLDFLVNNAAVVGAAALGDLLEFGDEQLDRIVDVNLKGTFRCSRSAARYMRDNGIRGVVVNIASVGAYAAQHRASAYVATKAGVVGLTRGMAFELAQFGIRVAAVAPGEIAHDAGEGIDAEGAYDVLPRQWWSRRSPLGRPGRALDIAHAVAFLVSDESSYITGTTLVVDGGWLSY